MLIICLPTGKCLQVLLFNTNYSIQHYSFGSKYCYVILIIQFRYTVEEGDFPRSVMVKVIDCGIVVNEFELQSCYF